VVTAGVSPLAFSFPPEATEYTGDTFLAVAVFTGFGLTFDFGIPLAGSCLK
jgi:hypothetical protein